MALITKEPQELSHYLVSNVPSQNLKGSITKGKWRKIDSGYKLSVGASNMKHKFPFYLHIRHSDKRFYGETVCWIVGPGEVSGYCGILVIYGLFYYCYCCSLFYKTKHIYDHSLSARI